MYDIITHGGGEVLWNTFNSVAIFFNKTGIMGGLLHIAFNLSIIVAITQMVITQDSIKAFKWSFLTLFVINALLLPKVDVLIVDRAAMYSKKVDNVPFVLGFSASFVSRLGDFLATKFDEVFSPPGLEYTKTGVAMASKLVSSSPAISLADPDSSENYTQFVRTCLMVDLVRGKYTAKEFHEAEDTWDFLAKTSSPIRGFPYKKPDGKSEILTCRKVAEQEKTRWSKYLISSGNNFSKMFFPTSPKPLNDLMQHFPVSYEYLTGISQDASLTLRQILMRNIIRDSAGTIAAGHGKVDIATSVASAKAQAQQKNTYMLHGDTASMSLSTLKVLFEVLIYALFPVAATIALFPGGLRIAKEYFIMMMSIQMWAPMYAVLNMVLNVMAKSKSMAAVTVIGASGEASKVISYGTIPKLVEANEWVSAVAGYGMSLIPFLAYGLFRYGAGALTQISSHFGGVAQSALSGAADMKTTGSMGIANRSFDTHSQNNTTSFKHNTNVDVAAGKITSQSSDGSTISQMTDGTYTINREGAMSKLGATLNVSAGMNGSLTEGADISHRAGMQHTQQSIESRAAALQQFRDAKQQRAHDITNGETFSSNDSVFQDSALAKQARLAEDIEKRFGIDKGIANEIVAGARLGAGVLSAGVSKSDRTSNSEAMAQAIRYAEEQGVQQTWKQAESEAKEGRYSTTDSSHKAFGQGISASLNDSISQQAMASASFSEEEAYRKSAQIAESLGANFNQDMSNVFLDRLVSSKGIEEANRIISNPDLLRREATGFIHAQAESLRNTIKSNPAFTFDPQGIKDTHENNVGHIADQNNIDKAFERHQLAIDNSIDKQLKEPIKDNVKTRVNAKQNEVKAVIAEADANIKDEKHKKTNELNDYKETNKVSGFKEIGKTTFDIIRDQLQPDSKKEN